MMATPKDGTVLNGAFWLNGQSWLIERPNQPLNEYLAESLQDQRQYIERLTKRADALEKWLNEKDTPTRQVRPIRRIVWENGNRIVRTSLE